MINYFVYNGRSSRDFRLSVEEWPSYTTPQRLTSSTQIPGRSGDLIYDFGSYGNVEVEYKVALMARPLSTLAAGREIAMWLQRSGGYRILRDSYRRDRFRRAAYTGPLEIENLLGHYGRATLRFECMPQVYLDEGEYTHNITSGQTLGNRWMPAKPLITVYGSGTGTLVIGKQAVRVSGLDAGPVVLDCENEDAAQNGGNGNRLVSLSAGWPVLQTGGNRISFYDGISGVKIKPRWWEL